MFLALPLYYSNFQIILKKFIYIIVIYRVCIHTQTFMYEYIASHRMFLIKGRIFVYIFITHEREKKALYMLFLYLSFDYIGSFLVSLYKKNWN